MWKATDDRPRGLVWGLSERLEYTDFAEDTNLVLHSQKDTQEKTDTVGNTTETVILNIHPTKTMLTKLNTGSTRKTNRERGKVLEEASDVEYLGSFFSEDSYIKRRNLHEDQRGSTSLQQTHQHLEIHFSPHQDNTENIQIQRPFSTTVYDIEPTQSF